MIDLVTDLPESEGMTTIAVFVDRLTKIVHVVPYKKDITAQQYAHLFIDHVFKLHGLPEVIISDHDPRFLSKFWMSSSLILERTCGSVRLSTLK